MTENKKTVERYMDGFNKSDHERILSCLTEDVEWEMPAHFISLERTRLTKR